MKFTNSFGFSRKENSYSRASMVVKFVKISHARAHTHTHTYTHMHIHTNTHTHKDGERERERELRTIFPA